MIDPATLPSLRRLAACAAVVRTGSVHAAARSLRLSPSTVSVLTAALARELGVPLVRRRGRRVEATPAGEAVAQAADEITAAASALLRLRHATERPLLLVGVAEDLPRTVARLVLEPALASPQAPVLRLIIDPPDRLFDSLGTGELDAVLSDRSPDPSLHPHLRIHRLGGCPVAFLAAGATARRLARGFPACLADAPCILPAPGDPLRRRLDQWFDEQRLQVRVVVETDDPALRKSFGLAGHGVFVMPELAHPDLARQAGVRRLGTVAAIEERWWLVTRRRPGHPALTAMVTAAQRWTGLSGVA
jgi:LysR family transcriptional activator of nhaA